MKPSWYRGWPLKPFASVLSFVLLIIVISILSLVLIFWNILFDNRPEMNFEFKSEDIVQLRMVHLYDSKQLDRLGLYAIIDPKDYSLILETLNFLTFHVNSPPRQDITDTNCFHLESTDGTTVLLCSRGYFKVEDGILTNGFFISPEVWSVFDQLWWDCIEQKLEP